MYSRIVDRKQDVLMKINRCLRITCNIFWLNRITNKGLWEFFMVEVETAIKRQMAVYWASDKTLLEYKNTDSPLRFTRKYES